MMNKWYCIWNTLKRNWWHWKNERQTNMSKHKILFSIWFEKKQIRLLWYIITINCTKFMWLKSNLLKKNTPLVGTKFWVSRSIQMVVPKIMQRCVFLRWCKKNCRLWNSLLQAPKWKPMKISAPPSRLVVPTWQWW